jgi:predicted phosphoribosyltransferase
MSPIGPQEEAFRKDRVKVTELQRPTAFEISNHSFSVFWLATCEIQNEEVEAMFIDRTDAGKQLAEALVRYQSQPVVVYALPRGGVVLGVEVARSLEAPLDLIVVRKIGHPLQPEYAIGAVAEDGYIITNPAETASLGKDWLDEAAALELQEAQRRRKLFLQGRGPLPVKDKIAIIVDDGLATGLTMLAAIHEMRKRHPKRIVVAVPVAASDTADRVRAEVDALVVLHTSERLGAIGSFYQRFDQVSDDEVVALMKSAQLAQMK